MWWWVVGSRELSSGTGLSSPLKGLQSYRQGFPGSCFHQQWALHSDYGFPEPLVLVPLQLGLPESCWDGMNARFSVQLPLFSFTKRAGRQMRS